MLEIPFKIGKDSLFNSKTTCFTFEIDYDRDLISIISDN